MSVHYSDSTVTVHHGDCLEVMAGMPENSVDAIVTDPPYGLSNTTPAQVADTITKWAGGDRDHVPTGRGFMGKSWDAFVPPPAVWDECLRVLKPGGHMVVFAGSRTQDLMGLSIRLAGFEIRDSLAWLYGSGFPKSMNVGKAIDKLAGAEREVIGRTATPFKVDAAAHRGTSLQGSVNGDFSKQADEDGYRYTEHTAPATTEAAQWDGWGTALKPAFEPIVLARKPLAEKTVARNVLAYGTGAINVDACRIEGKPRTTHADGNKRTSSGGPTYRERLALKSTPTPAPSGRWPANVLLDQHAAKALDQQSGTSKSKAADRGIMQRYDIDDTQKRPKAGTNSVRGHNDEGGASRFFKVAEPDPPFMYAAKAPKRERPSYTTEGGQTVQHATVKPLSIMQWLVKLVTPPGGTVLDPFAGSGTTIEAAQHAGHRVIGIELTDEYLPLIIHRLERADSPEEAPTPPEKAPMPPEVDPDQLDMLSMLDGTA